MRGAVDAAAQKRSDGMSRVILIYGQSGAGKTTSCRNLDPKSTLYIDCDGKGLSWQGWRKSFNAANKNYVRTTKIKSKMNLRSPAMSSSTLTISISPSNFT